MKTRLAELERAKDAAEAAAEARAAKAEAELIEAELIKARCITLEQAKADVETELAALKTTCDSIQEGKPLLS